MRHLAPFTLFLALAASCTTAPPPVRVESAPVQVPAAAAASADTTDQFLWLEEVEGDRAMAWVRERNARTTGILQSDPRYQRFHDEALKVLEATDRIPFPQFRNGIIYNFWQGPAHVRGILRRTTLASYRTATPQWETVLDVDTLSKHENANWVYRGLTCLPPHNVRCLVSLSPGGKDATVIREFDLQAKAFVPNGFTLPESKGGASWVDENTLIVSRDFGAGTLTSSGYAFTSRELKRGQSLANAREIFRGDSSDVSAGAFLLRDADGRIVARLASRGLTFWESDYYLLPENGRPAKLDLPARTTIRTLVDGQLIFTTRSDWKNFRSGDLVGYDVEALKRMPAGATPYLIHSPGPRESIEGVSSTRNKLVVTLYENVKGAAYVYDRSATGWTRRRLPLPENASVGIGSASDRTDQVFFSTSNFLTPNSLWLADAATGRVEKVKAIPERFDASNLVVEQYEATSADGTKVPYFVTRPKSMKLDGSNPTLLYGYGGFQSSLLPAYSGTIGKLWLEEGGVYVLANTRGGGEFGPQWHQAAIGPNRQRAHEDFVAVAQDVIARGVTSPKRLGIMGGSQGGLFVGVAMTQHPELFNAVVVQVPLFDMMRYHRLLAGASWVGEYGNPDIPEQRAWIAQYSPYQAIRAGQDYPEAFIHTSTKDDRVHPGHARKAAAKLEALGYPVLFYENTDGGHSAAANLRETARRLAMEFTYLSRKLKDPAVQP